MEYNELIDKINSHTVSQVAFKVKDYPHYSYCKICVVSEIFPSGHASHIITVLPTKDSEKVSFFETFNEKYKLFRMGRKGSFTLKQLWNKIEILEIK